MRFNGANAACSNCGKIFVDGEGLRFVGTFSVVLRAFSLSLGSAPVMVPVVDMQEWIRGIEVFHERCAPGVVVVKSSPADVDSIKRALNEMTERERRDVYKYLYESHDCRIVKL